MHLTKIAIKNYRVFKHQTNLDLAPITLLTGPNNSGKSSLIKFLLVLKDTFHKFQTEKNSRHSPWDFFVSYGEKHAFPDELVFDNKSKHHLGSFEEILSNNNRQKRLQFSLPFLIPEFKNNYHSSIDLTYEQTNSSYKNQLKNIIIRNEDAIILIVDIKREQERITYKFDLNLKYLTDIFNSRGYHFLEKGERGNEYINFGFYKYDIGKIEVDGEINPFNIEKESAFKSFGTTFYPHLNEFQGSFSPFFKLGDEVYIPNLLDKEFEPDHETEFSKCEFNFIYENTDKNGMFSFSGSFSYNIFPSVRRLLKFAFDKYAVDSYYRKTIKYPFGNGESSIFGFFKHGEETPKTIPFKFSDFGTFLIGLLDRSIHFNLTNYCEVFENLHFYPNTDLRFEQLINENEEGIYAILNQKMQLDEKKKQTIGRPDPNDTYKFIKVVLQALKLGEDILIESYKDYGYEIQILKNGKKIPLKNCGYGIRKLVTLVLRIASNASEMFEWLDDNDFTYKPSIIVLEEPESNLHPKLQSMLTAIFEFASNQFNMQFIVETHSEYLIRKIQYLVANADEPIKAKDVAIYYFNDLEESKNLKNLLKKITIRDDGILKDDFGPGFFDESTSLTIDLLNILRMN